MVRGELDNSSARANALAPAGIFLWLESLAVVALSSCVADMSPKVCDPSFLEVSASSRSFLDVLTGSFAVSNFPELRVSSFHGIPSLWISEQEISALAAPFQFSLAVYNCYMKLTKWSPLLRPHLFSPRILHGLGLIFGKPLKIDTATSIGSRPSLTCVLVELDVTKSYPDRVWLGPESSGYVQHVVMEDFPPFCSLCKKLGIPLVSNKDLINLEPVIPSSTVESDQFISDKPVNEDAVLPLVEVAGIMQVDASLDNNNVRIQSVVNRIDACDIVPLAVIDSVSADEVVAVTNLPVSEGVLGGVMPVTLDSRGCASEGGCAVNLCPLLGSVYAPSSLPGYDGPAVAMDFVDLSRMPQDRVVESSVGLAIVDSACVDASPVTPIDQVASLLIENSNILVSPKVPVADIAPTSLVDVPVKLIEPHAFVYHVGDNFGIDVRAHIDWLHCSSEYESDSGSSLESEGCDDPGNAFALLRDRPVVSVTSRGRGCGRGNQGR
ncbi:hypothetical protein IEQ34_017379 [Dendrobium chrysotoxum]|uniref:Uncharacterized protein n=1 Tax=Dendrobium chrysotoxum TaxID=161865 RepID=A0AAV7GA50_DENCH|nr:hypothetical protein IEQ34_017379 [Dendrobium chrysotoxum]